ncbi:5885_t:CDS:10 [Gigaspora margarita]|uniref:5885_t:CDS:1 n=1 Tax=Gigaspora margarita TaxID=4874 RepID=A0ABN7W9Q0_GIGMA|nr:5885_t:CDS:10 [Gigaspora margarita]
MSSPYKKLSIKKLPVPTEKGTEESRFWKRFKSRCSLSEIASVTSIKFSPIQPFDFAVTSSTRVQIYSTQTYKVFGINSRAILRTMQGHNHPVHITRFAPGNTQILSCSDDKTARIWDVPGQEAISIFQEHQDYVRAGLISNDNPHLVLTGSYDQSIKLWDLRTNSCTMSMSHGAPVEDVLMFPGGGMIISAGGPTITVWDLISGGRVVRSVSNHQKTITSMCFNGSSTRLLTGSLDHHVKIYDVQNYDVVHSIEYSSPILCIALSPDDTNIVAGMTCGTISIRRRKLVQKELSMSHQNKQPRVGSYKYFTRGQTYSVESKPRERLALYDRYLKKFQYSNALDAALRNGTQAILTISLLQELIRRDALRQAIVGRDDLSLEPLVKFLIRWINEPRYTSILVDVGNVIIGKDVIYKSPLIEKLIVNLHAKVKTEMNLQKEIAKIIGSLEMVAKGSLLTDTTNYT